MDLALLGSGGWIPTDRRETCCAYLRDGDRVLLIDAGTGVSRLVAHPELLAGVERLDILLTHFHLDHVVGLAYLQALPLRPTLWGGGELLGSGSTEAVLERLLGTPLFAAGPSELTEKIREIPAGAFEVGPFALATRIQPRHSDPTLAIRVDEMTYCTDTAADPENARFASGSRLLVHEAWHAADSTDDPTHTAAGEAARIAAEAGVESLVLIHVNPTLRADEELVDPARAVFEESAIGEDLVPLPGW